jgi:hypothetical protein
VAKKLPEPLPENVVTRERPGIHRPGPHRSEISCEPHDRAGGLLQLDGSSVSAPWQMSGQTARGQTGSPAGRLLQTARVGYASDLTQG